MIQTIIHAGSNVGNRFGHIQKAIRLINEQVGSVDSISKWYETSPWGIENQEHFINVCLVVHTKLKPQELLKVLQKIEHQIGRIKRPKWHEREIDLDILYYGDQTHDTAELKIPHPNMDKRNFVLIPLMDVAPLFIHPVLNKNTEELYLACQDTGQVVLLEDEKIQEN